MNLFDCHAHAFDGRLFRRGVSILLGTLLAASSALADDALVAGLPEVEPERVWSGVEFAEATAEWLKQNAPGLELKAPVQKAKSELEFSGAIPTRDDILEERGKVTNIDLQKGVRIKTLADLMTTRFLSEDLRGLGENLYLGGSIYYADEKKNMMLAEFNLRTWILAQPDGSVTPHELLGRAIIASEGNVLKALASSWNILSQNWEAAATRNTNVITSKLFDMTGEAALRDATGQFIVVDKEEARSAKGVRRDDSVNRVTRKQFEDRVRFVITKRGDKFSTYYHFFGVMLMSNYVSSRYGSGFWGRVFGKAGALMESFKHVETSGIRGERDKRIANDLHGAEAGARLFAILRGSKVNTPKENLLRHYAKPDPRFKGAYQLPGEMPPAYYGVKADPKFWKGPMGVEELTLRFTHAIWRTGDIFDSFILATSRDGDRLVQGLGDYVAELRAGKAGDPTLNQLISDYQRGFRGNGYRVSRQDFNLVRATELENHVRSQFPNYELEKNSELFKALILGISDIVRGQSCRRLFAR